MSLRVRDFTKTLSLTSVQFSIQTFQYTDFTSCHTPNLVPRVLSYPPYSFTLTRSVGRVASSETQGRSVGPGEKARQKFSSTGGKAPGYRLSPNHFQTVKPLLAPDWAQKLLCIIVPNRRTASPEFFSWVRTRRLLTRSRLVWLAHQRNARSQESFSLI